MGYKEGLIAVLVTFSLTSSASAHTQANILSESEWKEVLSKLGYKEGVDETVRLLATEKRDDGKWYGWVLIGKCIGTIEQSSPRTRVFVLSKLGGYNNLTLDRFNGTLADIRNVPASELQKAFSSKEIEGAFRDRCLPPR